MAYATPQLQSGIECRIHELNQAWQNKAKDVDRIRPKFITHVKRRFLRFFL